jgi:glycosyltransferase involved in cell wall biosynthesis
VPKKNAIGLVRALGSYRKQFGEPCTVRWAGKVSNHASSHQEYDDASGLLTELGLGDRWVWLGERSDVPQLLHNCDALIHPSFYEGLPNAICEALACGRPVLASRVCDNPRLVQEGETGFLFDPNDPQDISDAMKRFVNLAPAERRTMGQRARRFAESTLSLARYVSEYERLFERLVGQ